MDCTTIVRGFLTFLAALLISICPVKGQEAVEAGNSCPEKSKWPQPLICADGLAIDCRSATNTRERLYCAGSELQKADGELNRLYQRALKKLEKSSDAYANYRNARKAFIDGQRAWVRFKKTDCEVPGYLNIQGSTQANEVIDCELKHTKNRVADLNAHFAP